MYRLCRRDRRFLAIRCVFEDRQPDTVCQIGDSLGHNLQQVIGYIMGHWSVPLTAGIGIKNKLADPKVANWLLEPSDDVKCTSLDQLIQKYLQTRNGGGRRQTTRMERACTNATYTHRLTVHLVRRLQAEQHAQMVWGFSSSKRYKSRG